MAIGFAWQPLTPEVVDGLPEAMAVFEIGSLVRSVLFIGGDANEGLRSCVRRALDDPRLRLRARCLRYELTADPRARVGHLLAAYRSTHDGALPAEQPRGGATVHSLLPVSAEPRAVPMPAEPATAHALEAASFLRVRTVA